MFHTASAIFAVGACLLIGLPRAALAQSANARKELEQMVRDLQVSPNDDRLREMVIRRAQDIRPELAVPDEAKRFMARGRAAFEDARGVKDYEEAAGEFDKAVRAA